VTDTTLIEHASVWRAPTPTAAAERAVPVRADLLEQMLGFEGRLLRCFSRGMEDRKRHLAQLARVLPRAEALFAAPRQRLDVVSDRLQHALSRNLQLHGGRFAKAAALLRARLLKDRMAVCAERVAALGERAVRAERARLAVQRRHLDSLARLLDGLSYRGVLERGFALVRGADGTVRRRAAAVKPGEALTLTFADGEVKAGEPGTGGGAPRPRKAKASDQGSLF
jgi:exodeoxyribonuclease VII large subunit